VSVLRGQALLPILLIARALRLAPRLPSERKARIVAALRFRGVGSKPLAVRANMSAANWPRRPPLIPRLSLLTHAVSFSGRVEAADAALRLIQESGSRLAVESFAAITGMPLGAPFIEEAPPTEEGGSGRSARTSRSARGGYLVRTGDEARQGRGGRGDTLVGRGA